MTQHSDFEFAADMALVARSHEPTPSERDRLLRRVRATQARPSTILVRAWWVGVAAVAALGLAVAGGLGSRRPLVLASGRVQVGPGIEAQVQGEGTARVTATSTEVQWTRGVLTLEVERQAGRSVLVRTEEAEVWVVGTGFTVERGELGTEVSVHHGLVDVVCRAAGWSAPVAHVSTGSSVECWPDAAAGLGRLLALERQEASADARLRVIDEAFKHPVGRDTTRSTLAERRVDVLLELGRDDEAVEATLQLPPEVRHARLTRGADSAMRKGECEAAEGWLKALVDLGDAAGTLLRVQCLADEDPVEARAVLGQLEGQSLPAPLEAVAQEWRAVLSER